MEHHRRALPQSPRTRVATLPFQQPYCAFDTTAVLFRAYTHCLACSATLAESDAAAVCVVLPLGVCAMTMTTGDRGPVREHQEEEEEEEDQEVLLFCTHRCARGNTCVALPLPREVGVVCVRRGSHAAVLCHTRWCSMCSRTR